MCVLGLLMYRLIREKDLFDKASGIKLIRKDVYADTVEGAALPGEDGFLMNVRWLIRHMKAHCQDHLRNKEN
jgi:hypothetical protein